MNTIEKEEILAKVEKFDRLHDELLKLNKIDDKICEILDFEETENNISISLSLSFYVDNVGGSPTGIDVSLTEFINRKELAQFIKDKITDSQARRNIEIDKL